MSTEYLQRHYSAQGSFVKNYDPQRGWLTSKVYADGKATGYTYTDGGRLHTRTWARQVDSQPLTTTYGYNAAGDLTSTVYSDSTPAVAITYNRLGQKLSAGNSASQIGYTYNEQLRVEGELMTNGGFFTSFKHYYDALGRPSGLQSGDAGVDAVSYGYDAAGRLATVRVIVVGGLAKGAVSKATEGVAFSVGFPSSGVCRWGGRIGRRRSMEEVALLGAEEEKAAIDKAKELLEIVFLCQGSVVKAQAKGVVVAMGEKAGAENEEGLGHAVAQAIANTETLGTLTLPMATTAPPRVKASAN